MAQYRFSSQVIGRSTGRSAVAAAAYRAGQSLADERTGQVHDFSRKGGVLHTEIMAPDNAPDWMRDRQRLWNAVEVAEKRGDAQLSREVQLSLPHELTDEQRLGLVRDFVNSQFVARGMIADMAIHSPGREGDDRNHHAHIMLTMRELAGEGFGKKAREWNDKALLQTWREEWAHQQNAVLERFGHPTKVDHRSLEAQGIDREPAPHLGAHAHQMEQQGKASRIGDEARAVDARNQERAGNHQQAAVINLSIERHRRQFAQVAAERVDALRDSFVHATIDLERRQERQRLALQESLEKQYGASQRTMSAELAAIDGRARSTGWKKVLRVVTGAEARDRVNAEKFQKGLANIEQRKHEASGALDFAQAEARTVATKAQAAKVEALKTELAREGARKEKQILAVQRRQAWEAQRTAQKEAKAEQNAKPRYRPKDYRPTAEQQAKGIERKERNALPPPRENPVKDAFENVRKIEQGKPAPIKHEARFVSTPAPSPSPMGEVKTPARVVQNVPQKAPPARQAAPPSPRKEFVRQAPATPAPALRRDMGAAAKAPPTPAPVKASPAQTKTPAPAPSPAPVQSAPRKDWQTASTPDKPRQFKTLPPRDPNKTRDR